MKFTIKYNREEFRRETKLLFEQIDKHDNTLPVEENADITEANKLKQQFYKDAERFAPVFVTTDSEDEDDYNESQLKNFVDCECMNGLVLPIQMFFYYDYQSYHPKQKKVFHLK